MAWEFVRLAIAATVVFILPGWLILNLIRWKTDDVPKLSFLPLAFSLSIAFISILGVFGYVLGLSLTFVESVVLGIAALFLLERLLRAALQFLGLRLALSESGFIRLPTLSAADGAVIAFVAFAASLAAWVGAWFSHTADTFYHLAGVRTLLAEDSVLVERVLYADSPGGLDPTSGTWHLALALVGRLSDLDIAFIWAYLPPGMAILLVLSFYSFAAVLFKNGWWAFWATVVNFVVLFQLDFRNSPYPNIISLAILWTALMMAFHYLETRDRKALAIAWAGGFTLAAVHLFTFELFILSIAAYVGAALLVLYWRRGLWADIRRLLVLAGVPSLLAIPIVVAKVQGAHLVSLPGSAVRRDFRDIGLVAGGLEDIPALSFLGDTLLKPITSLDISQWAADNFYIFNPSRLVSPWALTAFGGELVTGILVYVVVLLLLPGLLAGRRANIFLVTATMLVPLVLLNPLIVSPLTGRMTDIPFLRLPNLVPFALVVVAVLAPVATHAVRVARCRGKPRLMKRYLVVCAGRSIVLRTLRRLIPAGALVPLYTMSVLILIVGTGAALFVDIANGAFDGYLSSAETNALSVDSSRTSRLNYEDGVFSFLREEARPGSVVLSDIVTSYYIGGLTGLPVVAVPRTHSLLRVEGLDGPQRRLDATKVLDPDNEDLLGIVRILEKYDVRYVVTTDRSLMERHPDQFRQVYNDGSIKVFAFVRNGTRPSSRTTELDTAHYKRLASEFSEPRSGGCGIEGSSPTIAVAALLKVEGATKLSVAVLTQPRGTRLQ
ncbi:MAG: hypothetical protein ACE5JL_03175 [Dehalococcoidia bacterium]